MVVGLGQIEVNPKLLGPCTVDVEGAESFGSWRFVSASLRWNHCVVIVVFSFRVDFILDVLRIIGHAYCLYCRCNLMSVEGRESVNEGSV